VTRFLGYLCAIAAIVLMIVAFGQPSLGEGALWGIGGVALLAAAAGLLPQKAGSASAESRHDVSPRGSGSQGRGDRLDPEVARRFAAALAVGGGVAVFARTWAGAWEQDNSVPPYGERPYWTPTGPGGAPELLSAVGLKGTPDRLRLARELPVGDHLRLIMADDPDQRVRAAAREGIS